MALVAQGDRLFGRFKKLFQFTGCIGGTFPGFNQSAEPVFNAQPVLPQTIGQELANSMDSGNIHYGRKQAV